MAKLPSLPGKTKQQRDIMRTFMGCDVEEYRASYLISSPFYATACELLDKGWLTKKLDTDNPKYYFFALTVKGKDLLKPREKAYADRF